MPLTDGEFASILSDDTKRIEEDLLPGLRTRIIPRRSSSASTSTR